MGKLVLTLLAVVSLCTPAAADRSGDAGCEPAGTLNIAAHRHSVTDLGTTARVVVDLKIYSVPDPTGSVVIDGRVLGGGMERAIAARQASLPAGRTSKVRFTFELEQGIEHQIEFRVRAAGDPSLSSTATLRVDLDPAHEPERLNGVVQYRAQMQGGTQ